MKHWLLSVLLMVCSTVSAQITLVKDGKSNARIIVQDKMPNSKTSAELLQHFSIIFRKAGFLLNMIKRLEKEIY